jgi:hypothetical protein
MAGSFSLTRTSSDVGRRADLRQPGVFEDSGGRSSASGKAGQPAQQMPPVERAIDVLVDQVLDPFFFGPWECQTLPAWKPPNGNNLSQGGVPHRATAICSQFGNGSFFAFVLGRSRVEARRTGRRTATLGPG